VASLSQVAGVLSARTKESTTARTSVALSTKEPHHSTPSVSLERNYIIEVTVLTSPVFLRCTWLLEGFTRLRAELLSSRPITNPQGGLHTQAETNKKNCYTTNEKQSTSFSGCKTLLLFYWRNHENVVKQGIKGVVLRMYITPISVHCVTFLKLCK